MTPALFDTLQLVFKTNKIDINKVYSNLIDIRLCGNLDWKYKGFDGITNTIKAKVVTINMSVYIKPDNTCSITNNITTSDNFVNNTTTETM